MFVFYEMNKLKKSFLKFRLILVLNFKI